ncbi:MAG: polysaccharide pyruvyl transferase CsaB, partial [Firmicutes bacterium]|nr:polysaccharide pyruvyl transferase CsaB [Bacillota bacterium]
DDIKRYLIENYHVPAKDIFVTINGIDTEKFSPAIKGETVRTELDLKGEPTIVCVSRLDADSAVAAEKLVKIAPALERAIPQIRIVIAGAGDYFDTIKANADKVNSKARREVISMLGPRTDINEIVAVSDVFVGVSRAALEAMAAAKPVILAGNEGYMGIFQKEKLNAAINTNFCCRDCSYINEQKLLEDIIYLFGISGEERSELGRYCRKVIFEHYSVREMTDICIRAYDAAWRQSHTPAHNVVMSGYYGFNNSGDEAILLAMYKSISALSDNMNIIVLSSNPDETRKRYGIPVVSRFSLPAVVNSISKCDILLSGGGSLLQDTTSTRSILYYLSIIAFAKFMRKKVMLYANGIGPVSRNANREMVRKVVNRADLITLREENSLEELIAMGVDKSKAYVTADPVFTMDGVSDEEAKKLLEKAGVPDGRPILGVSVRKWYKMESFAENLAKLCDRIYDEFGYSIVFIVMQFPNDIIMSENIRSRMKRPSHILDALYSPYELMGIIGQMELILSMRLHTLIFAAKQRVPLLGFIYDPKIEYYLNKLSMPSGGVISGFD